MYLQQYKSREFRNVAEKMAEFCFLWWYAAKMPPTWCAPCLRQRVKKMKKTCANCRMTADDGRWRQGPGKDPAIAERTNRPCFLYMLHGPVISCDIAKPHDGGLVGPVIQMQPGEGCSKMIQVSSWFIMQCAEGPPFWVFRDHLKFNLCVGFSVLLANCTS